jgi:hypothetical protein
MVRPTVPAALFLLVAASLAGCISQGTEPVSKDQLLGGPRTIGGASSLPDIKADGATVIPHPADGAVELVWKGSADPRPSAPATPLPVGVPNPLPPQVDVHPFDLPTSVTEVNATLAWAGQNVNLALAVRNDAGRSQCRGVADPSTPTSRECFTYIVGARNGTEKWHVDVTNVQNSNPGAIPYELHLTLSVKPFPLLGPALDQAHQSPNLAFWDTRVDENRRTGEPSLKVDQVGDVYVAAPTGPMESLWRSKDNGKTFEHIDLNNDSDAIGTVWSQEQSGGGDSDVAVTDDGKEVYFGDLWACMSVAGSADSGKTWHTNPLSCDLPITDRQWLAAKPGGHVWITFNGLNGLTILHSINGGTTWLPPAYVAEDNCSRGNIVVDKDNRVLVSGCNADGPGVAVSEDEGRTFTWHNVAKRSGTPLGGFCYTCGIFNVIDVDTAGNAYIVWADPSQDNTQYIWMATSKDHGATWSTPVRVNSAGGSAVQPWIAAAEPGHVAIAWYQTKQAGNPSNATGEWYAHFAESLDALNATPTFVENLIWDTPVQYGPICLSGSSCSSSRNLLDFLMVDIDQTGASHIAFIDGGHGGAPGNSYVMYAHMTKGLDIHAANAKPPAAAQSSVLDAVPGGIL